MLERQMSQGCELEHLCFGFEWGGWLVLAEGEFSHREMVVVVVQEASHLKHALYDLKQTALG